MARRSRKPKSPDDGEQISDYRYPDKRKNIPPAGLAAQGKVKEVPKTRYAYDPHLSPLLRFDDTGEADHLPDLLAEAQQRPLNEEEAQMLADALRNHHPWLEWAGKREKHDFEVDPIALHIHERVSAQAILKLAQREPLQRSLFADPELEYRQAIKFYEHDMDWANRLILGDSLVVMHSLARREDLAGKVQMIYMDPPYGIKFASNFQPLVGKRDVKDRAEDLTRAPEQIKAYRDTWTLGVHSYLAYLRDRLVVARELLADTGSIFVQISDENLHRVRLVIDEVFGNENFIAIITFRKFGVRASQFLDSVVDYIVWYAKDRDSATYRQLFYPSRRASNSEFETVRLYRTGGSPSGGFQFEYQNRTYQPSANLHWATSIQGLNRLAGTERLVSFRSDVRYKRYQQDFPYTIMTTTWDDTWGEQEKTYAVQTSSKVIERCILMTTDPGDLVLDPTCGSGTTAYVAEQWGRRWITIDTSRVAIALARQRLLTAKYDYYELADPDKGVSGSFVYKTVPHIMLKSIAQNLALDPIFARWGPVLTENLDRLNAALGEVTPEIRTKLQAKLAEVERREGRRAITDADRRRWLLPADKWEEWEVPFETDPDWPETLQTALREYRTAWRQKMDEVNVTIAASAPQETLVDQPNITRGVLRVSGPFTVEGVQPAEESLDLDTPIGGEPEELETFDATITADEPANASAYLEKMIRLLRKDGVRFPDNKVMKFARLDPLPDSILHADGEWGDEENGDIRHVAVAFGPQYGPITAQQVEECLREAYRRGYDDLVFAGFTIDGMAQGIIQDDPNPRVHCHLAHISPDVNMGDLLKDTPGSQLFTVFGLPRVRLEPAENAEWIVEMEGVDIYDPVSNTIQPTRADKVAAWFLDSDYDGYTFCITQAFFPDSKAWDKLARALKSTVDPERFAAFSGTRSLPFPAGEHKRIAVKVIDPRGNEVMRVMSLEGQVSYA